MSGYFGEGLILTFCMYPFIFIMFGLLKMESAPKKGLYFGVKLTGEQVKAPEVEAIVKKYNKQMIWNLVILLLLPIPMLFVPWFSIFFVLWEIWFMYSLVAFFVPFWCANVKLKRLKEEKGWKEEAEATIYVELKEAGRVRKVKWYHFLPQCLMGVVCFLAAFNLCITEKKALVGAMLGSFAALTFLFWMAAVWMDGLKTQVISNNSDINLNYNRAKKNLWKNFWIICSWIHVVYMGVLAFAWKEEQGIDITFWTATIIYTIGTFLMLVWLIAKKASLDKKYEEHMNLIEDDNEDNWLGGMIYYNPKDKHTMVEKRFGVGNTVNMARPSAKIMAGILLILFLQMPVVGIWCVLLEFTPIQLRVENNQLIASQMKEEIVIPLFSIKDVEVLTELPAMSRNHGTSMEELKKGSYMVKEDKTNCQVFLNPQNGKFLRIETSIETYYLSGFDDEETIAVFESIK